MRSRIVLFKFGMAGLVMGIMLGMGGPVTEAAGVTVLVDNVSPATDCGKYTGQTATNVVTAINSASSGSTILICPGTYNLNSIGVLGGLKISDRKLSIKQAVPSGADHYPILQLDPDVAQGMSVDGSTVTIDGIVLDARTNTQSSFIGISLYNSSAMFKNMAVLGPDVSTSSSVIIEALGITTLSVTNSTIAGYGRAGIWGSGRVKVTVTRSVLDATDGGRVTSQAIGVAFISAPSPDDVLTPTGSVTNSILMHHAAGVLIQECSKIKVSGNTLIDNESGVTIAASGLRSADGNTITGNTFSGIPSGATGIRISDTTTSEPQINKTVISKNTFVSAGFAVPGATNSGVYLEITPTGATTPTAILSGNRFIGFVDARRIFNLQGRALVTEKSSETLP